MTGNVYERERARDSKMLLICHRFAQKCQWSFRDTWLTPLLNTLSISTNVCVYNLDILQSAQLIIIIIEQCISKPPTLYMHLNIHLHLHSTEVKEI